MEFPRNIQDLILYCFTCVQDWFQYDYNIGDRNIDGCIIIDDIDGLGNTCIDIIECRKQTMKSLYNILCDYKNDSHEPYELHEPYNPITPLWLESFVTPECSFLDPKLYTWKIQHQKTTHVRMACQILRHFIQIKIPEIHVHDKVYYTNIYSPVFQTDWNDMYMILLKQESLELNKMNGG